jgi:putative SOS response-associated peptidase YedK
MSPIFRDAFQRRRCLVPVERWYEYMGEKGSRQPVAFEKEDDSPFALAGIWESNPLQEKPLASFAILTLPASEFILPYHTRMPLVLPREAYADWLDPTPRKPKELEPLLKPYLPDHFRAKLESPSPRAAQQACKEEQSLFKEEQSLFAEESLFAED